jgi:hypothetical protein
MRIQKLCQTGKFTEIEELLSGVTTRHRQINTPLPEMVTADNCCAVRKSIEGSIPGAKVVLDVHHFAAR